MSNSSKLDNTVNEGGTTDEALSASMSPTAIQGRPGHHPESASQLTAEERQA